MELGIFFLIILFAVAAATVIVAISDKNPIETVKTCSPGWVLLVAILIVFYFILKGENI